MTRLKQKIQETKPFLTRHQDEIDIGSYWFKRLWKEYSRYPYLRFRRARHGFFRIYWKEHYIHEVYKEMPNNGYDIEDVDPRFENKSYYEEYEDKAELTRKLKNFVEGYYDSKERLDTRLYMCRNDDEFANTSGRAYQRMNVL